MLLSRREAANLLTTAVMTFILLILAGVILEALELDSEEEAAHQYLLQKSRMEAIIAHDQAILSQCNISHFPDHLQSFMNEVEKYALTKASVPDVKNPKWNFKGSFFFAGTVLTTIGYGTYAPSTTAGRWFVIFLAMIGIPVMTIFLGHFTLLFQRFIEWVTDRTILSGQRREGQEGNPASSPRKTPSPKGGPGEGETEGDQETAGARKRERVNDVAFWCLTLLFVGISALMFHYHSQHGISAWTFGQTFYFTIVSLTTVGLGDFAPDFPKESTGMIFVTLLFWVMGLSMFAVVMGNTQNVLDRHLDKLCAKVAGVGANVEKAIGTAVKKVGSEP